MLTQPVPSLSRWIGGSVLVALLSLAAGFAAWASQPSRPVIDVHAGNPAQATLSTRVDGGKPPPPPPAAPAPPIAAPPPPPVPAMIALSAPPPPALPAPSVAAPPPPPVPAAIALPEPPPPPSPPDPAAARMPPPPYPPQALKEGIDGTVVLLIDIGADGRPTRVQVDHATPAGVFDAAAVDAAKRWTFEPGRKDGKPVASRVKVPVRFEAPAPAAPPAAMR